VTRSSSGHQVNQAIAIAYPGGDVRLLDLFGNQVMQLPELKEWVEGDEIVYIEGSPISEE
jgi:hypothetical protein